MTTDYSPFQSQDFSVAVAPPSSFSSLILIRNRRNLGQSGSKSRFTDGRFYLLSKLCFWMCPDERETVPCLHKN